MISVQKERTLMKRYSITGIALLAIALPASTQEVEEKAPERPSIQDQNPLAQDSQQEILELFKKVERKLRRIDRLLLDASAGDTSSLGEIDESGMDDLFQTPPNEQAGAGSSSDLGAMLSASQSQGQEVLSGIDRIIEIAQEAGSAGAACQKPDPNKPSPIDDRGQQRTKENQTPDKPQEQKPEPGEQPKDSKPSDDEGKNKPATSTPDTETQDAGPPPQDKDHWGDLPIHVRQVFRAEGGRQMPSQYRDWIDAYYRRLNSRTGD